MVRGGDDDGVDVGTGEDFAVVARREDVFAVAFFGEIEAALIDVGDGDEFGAGNGDGGRDVALAHDAEANAREIDFIIRALGGGGGGSGGEDGSGTGGLKEGTAGGGHNVIPLDVHGISPLRFSPSWPMSNHIESEEAKCPLLT